MKKIPSILTNSVTGF